jgi:hypothetical protein
MSDIATSVCTFRFDLTDYMKYCPPRDADSHSVVKKIPAFCNIRYLHKHVIRLSTDPADCVPQHLTLSPEFQYPSAYLIYSPNRSLPFSMLYVPPISIS